MLTSREALDQEYRPCLSSERQIIRKEHIQIPSNGVKNQVLDLKDAINWNLGQDVELWWPVGYGKQILYAFEVILLGEVSPVTHKLPESHSFCDRMTLSSIKSKGILALGALN